MNHPAFSPENQKTKAENNPKSKLKVNCKHCTETPGVLSSLEDWLDSCGVTALLHISSRTLHTLRKNDILPYSQFRRRIYHKRSDTQRILGDNYIIFKLRNGKK